MMRPTTCVSTKPISPKWEPSGESTLSRMALPIRVRMMFASETGMEAPAPTCAAWLTWVRPAFNTTDGSSLLSLSQQHSSRAVSTRFWL